MSQSQPTPQAALEALDEFRAGVTACLRSWSVLRTAVESGWGGTETESFAKVEDLRYNLFQHFDGTHFPEPKSLTIEDLEDNLAIYMEEEFSIVLEDNSEKQLASEIFRMYEACGRGDMGPARAMVAMAKKAVEATRAANVAVQIQSNEFDDDDDDDDAMEVCENTNETKQGQDQTPATLPGMQLDDSISASEYAAQPVFGSPKKKSVVQEPVRQLGETVTENFTAPVVDEDGFATVTTGKRKKQRKPV